MGKIWSNRFKNSLNPFIEKFNASLSFDKKLILEDIECSIVHAKMLGKTEVLSSEESLEIIDGLETIKIEFLEFINIKEDEFWDIAEKWRNSNLWSKKGNDWVKRFPVK